MKVSDIKVEMVDSMGSDLDVADAARVSFDKKSAWQYTGVKEEYDDNGAAVKRHLITQLSDKDKSLLKYLAEHNHWSPFSHCYLKFRIKAPIFVARQLQKHTVGLAWNEVSRRYVDSEPEFYLPMLWRGKAENKKQGSSDTSISIAPIYDMIEDDQCVHTPDEITEDSLRTYKSLLRLGVCPEQARMVLPQNMMTEWIWSGSLYAFARVCNLRLDSHAQAETREVAVIIKECMERRFPESVAVLIKESV